ncbi:hypothetical protein STCU_05636 [Strigomonas culicis]|uniref:Uncharacterized protein n=1 Tax=Strigomonas culicis TaxID=28005 RepID=S9UA83_9TRYP|nr:hypothetical protein STCU_05636 [Strigomonas culicis]|eukprot:EPY27667.1 hypothetical protein STCU_05636 [Strigomonas culicis]
MFRSTLRRLGGGHGDLFPTSKEAAHLTPTWVMQREVPHAPGKGKRYVRTTAPEHFNKFQLHTPPTHEVATMTIGQAAPHHCHTRLPSSSAVAHTVAGTHHALDTHHKKNFDNAVARGNIAEKAESERLMTERDFTAGQRPARVAPGYEHTIDVVELNEYWDQRVSTVGRRMPEAANPNGWTKEFMPWEKKPKPKKDASKK